MSDGLEETIPAYSMWKMLNETIPELKRCASEINIKKLVNIIQSEESSNIFVCYKDPSTTFEHYQANERRYKSFTVWVLGQFFSLLGSEKLTKLHDVIIDTQLCILNKLSRTQLHVYHELTLEYYGLLHKLVSFSRRPEGKLSLEAFVPDDVLKLDLRQTFLEVVTYQQSVELIVQLLKLIKQFLIKSFMFYSFDKITWRALDDLISLLEEVHEVRLEVFQIFLDILCVIEFDSLDIELRGKFMRFSSILEQFCYKTYDDYWSLRDNDLSRFEEILSSYLQLNNFINTERINKYILQKLLSSDQIIPCEKVSLMAIKSCSSHDSFSIMYKSTDFSQPILTYIIQRQLYKDLLQFEGPLTEIQAYNKDTSMIFSQVYRLIIENLENLSCADTCYFEQFLIYFHHLTNVLIQIRLDLMINQNSTKVQFFQESNFLDLFIKRLFNHWTKCTDTSLTIENILGFFTPFALVTNSKNCEIIFNILAYPLLGLSQQTVSNQLSFIGNGNVSETQNTVRSLFKSVLMEKLNPLASLKLVRNFFEEMGSGLVDLNESQRDNLEVCYLKTSKAILQTNNEDLISVAIEIIPHAIFFFNDVDKLLSETLTTVLLSSNKQILENALRIVPDIICSISSETFKTLKWDEKGHKLSTSITCKQCFGEPSNKYARIYFAKVLIEDDIVGLLLKNILGLLSNNRKELKMYALSALPALSSHCVAFHTDCITRMWLKLAGDSDKEVRMKFAKIIAKTIHYGQVNPVISKDVKMNILKVTFDYLLNLAKNSLKFSNFNMQFSILMAIEELIVLKSDYITNELMKILFYFIMVPTSKYSLVAVNKCFSLAKANSSNPSEIYSQNKKHFCEIIAHLCYVNQGLLNYSLSTSLEHVSPLLGSYNSKEFILEECNYLLPFFVSKIVEAPAVAKLIQEIADVMEMDIAELLTCKYGYIFIHIFLDLSNINTKQCMQYLEDTTGMSGPTLRKRNFRIILNELLLNFHEKNDKVTKALKMIADEDTENKTSSLQDFLQPHFLGVLLNFDMKLISNNLKKDMFLLSLADLFRYMGPKHIMPLRFKIMAMLQTTSYYSFPDLNCKVWDAFLKTCEIEALGPQLATIVACLSPLLDHCPREINKILKYLIVDNETFTKDHIADLFFVDHPKIEHEVLVIIKKYVRSLQECTIKQKIQKFLKYLTHETVEIRIHGLRHLKGFLEENREELDKMILDYNGIDPNLVELIDVLTSGCREDVESLRMTCGEVFGELGAVEPSHLPRRYAPNQSSFCFYINEDTFIINCLNELIRALQAEKNTQSMNRYSLAIQEVLKEYEISPDQEGGLWYEFPKQQREVMLPLLSSRYVITQPVLPNNVPNPIYGSNLGTSFQLWLFNWTSSLIASLPETRQKHLIVCLPSMRHDNRVLMHFLPYILLHALLEGTENILEKALIEIQTVTNSFIEKKHLDPKVLNLRPIPIDGMAAKSPNFTPEGVKETQCTKVVFLLLDFLERWTREWQWQKGLSGMSDAHYKTIKNFLGKLCKLQLAKCNYHSGEYPRALLYLEDYISENISEKSNHLDFLAEIYAQLEEPDGVDGVTALRPSEPSIESRILELEVSGKLEYASKCYEKLLEDSKLHHMKGLVQCHLNLDNTNIALYSSRGALDNLLEFGNISLELQAEPLWRLSHWEDLDRVVKCSDLASNKSWAVQVSRALLCFKAGEGNIFRKILDELLKQQVESFGAASLEEGAYQHGYAYISRLHALNEFQKVERIVSNMLLKPADDQYARLLIEKLGKEWSLRIKVVQESVRIVEPIMCLRIVLLNLARDIVKEKIPGAVSAFDSLIGECWLLSAKTARAAKMHQKAYAYTLSAEKYAPSMLFLEKAKLHWARDEHQEALMTLRRGVDNIMPENISLDGLSLEKKKLCAEARLLIATYNEEITNVDVDMNLDHYKKAFEIYKEWEKSMVCLAQYYDKIFETYSGDERDRSAGDIQLHMINYFGKSLQYGTNYVYQSMPRLLSIWFDYGTRLLAVRESSIKEERKLMLLQMTKLIDCFLERLPTYIFLTAFSQLVSRICHPQKEVYCELKCIIIKLIEQYPQQSLWMIISVIKSSYPVRMKRCSEILNDPRLKSPTLMKLFKDFTSLAEKLIELCNREISRDASIVSVNSIVRTLPRLLIKEDFSEIMMPTYKFRKLILPNPNFTSSQHNPFPNHYVHITGIEDQLTVLASLQKPRKITLKGSDGKGYVFILKARDDLRKDFRLMEFNDIVNHLLVRDGEARQRRLNIRLYSVAPLNEECGMIEWVWNLVGLRPVILNLYQQKGLGLTSRDLKQMSCHIKDSLPKKRDIFLKKLLPKHPPVLNEWFRKTFPDAQSWFTARSAYIRTTAVISIAGYILGLGDRHGENIQLDSTCGDTVHVDFNCLFNKGEKFEWPERVPFRLTHNMVAAMGPLGVEGMFRKSCVCTLRVLRDNTDTLMSIVAPFVYDPLVSWTKNMSALPSPHNAEMTNVEAVDHIKNVELRLQGRVKTRYRTLLKPLSVEGQVNYLISEAVSIDNICQMYIGWGPYL